MDYNKYLDQIEKNKLDMLDYDFLIVQLCVLNNKPFVDMKEIVDNLIHSGKLVIKGSEAQLGADDSELYVKKKLTKKKHTKTKKTEVASPYSRSKGKNKKSVKRLKGQIDRTIGGYAFLLPDDDELDDIFISARQLRGALNKDRVVIETMPYSKRMEGKVVQVIERGQQRIVGRLHIIKNAAFVSPDDVKFGADIAIPLNKIKNANNGDKVVVKIEKYYASNRMPEGVITEVLGPPDKIEVEVLSIIRAYDLYETFPINVTEKAKTFPNKVNENHYKHRKDLIQEICFTIDGEDSRDLDDAIGLKVNSAGNRVLSVHIADVGEYVPLNGVIDKEAFVRGTSVYFPGLVLPMLPRELSNGICSINENQTRLALTLEIECDDNGNVIDYKFFESMISSKKRFTYTTVQKILDGDKQAQQENKQFVNILFAMRDLSKQFLKKRVQLGSLQLNIPEVHVVLNELGGISLLDKRVANDSTNIIEAFMVTANECVAQFFYKNKLPFVYRVHEKPTAEKMEVFLSFVRGLGVQTKANNEKVTPKDLQHVLNQVQGKESEFAVSKICLRSLQKAKYSPTCLGHFGLASKYYCHFTSPIRRYPDLTIHRIIKDYLRGKLKGKHLTETRRFALASALNSSEREVQGEKVERDVDDLYRAYYMKDKVGEVYDGIIGGVTKFGCFVQLENTVEGFVKLGDLPLDNYEYIEEKLMLKGKVNTFEIGKKLKIMVAGVDVKTRRIDFVLA